MNRTSDTLPSAARVFQREIAPQAPLYALFDAARESAARFQSESAGLTPKSLFAGDMGEKLAEVAPYLVEFPARSAFRDWWFGKWGSSIGVLVEADVGLADLRQHFRTLMMVRDEGRKRYYFRFYDPRVITAFLPACSSAELERFWGPMTAIYCEAAEGREFVAYSRGGHGELVCRKLVVPG